MTYVGKRNARVGTPRRPSTLTLEIGQLGLEPLHGVAVVEQHMALDEAEEPQDLFRGRPLAAPLFWVQR